MNVLKTMSRWMDTINEWVGRGVGWVTLALVLVVFTDVVMRYLFNTSFVFTQELEWHLFGFIFLIGAGYTLLHNGHVRVDIIYQRLGFKGQAWVNLCGVLLFLIPGCIMVITTSWKFTVNSYAILEGSPDLICNPGGFTGSRRHPPAFPDQRLHPGGILPPSIARIISWHPQLDADSGF